MGLLRKVRTMIAAYSHELADKVIDVNSIPVVKQYVRDLEEALGKTKHEAAAAAAQIVTLTTNHAGIVQAIETNKKRAQAYLAKNDEKAARVVANQIHDEQTELNSLDAQIQASQDNSTALDNAVEKIQAKHQFMLSQLRMLTNKDHGAKALEQATSSLKAAGAISSLDVSSSVDGLAQRINERSDLAKEEFNRTVGEFSTPNDPLKEAAVDDILASLQPTTVEAKP